MSFSSSRKFLAVISMSLVGACTKFTPYVPPPVKAPAVGELSRASYAGDLDEVKRLVGLGASVNEVVGSDDEAVTPLLAATAGGQSQTAQFLLSKGANPSASFRGLSSQDFAQESNNKELIEVLSRYAPRSMK